MALQSTPAQDPSSRRISQVYVEVPPSPYTRGRDAGLSHDLKENIASIQSTAIRRVSNEKSNHAPASTLKRKAPMLAVLIDNQKKPKVSPPHDGDSKTVQPKPDAQPSQGRNASEQFPNGYFSCHHCRTRQQPNCGIQCTVRIGLSSNGKERRCKVKYCMFCLKQRYGEDLDQILKKGQRPTSESTVHVAGVPYVYECLRCRGLCNCSYCRKDRTTKQGKKGTLPPPKWIPVDTGLSLVDAEARIQVREFVFRFKATMNGITDNHLEELDWLYGSDADEEEDWISHGCVKAIILALLHLIAEDETGPGVKVINTAIKDLRRAGAKLERVWGILLTLREELTTSSILADTLSSRNTPLTFSDPRGLSAPNCTVRTTRSGSTQITTTPITHSAQMLPVLVSLINLALQTGSIRQDIESAGALVREWVADGRQAHKAEHDRWVLDRKALFESCESRHLTEDERVAQLKSRDALRDKIFRNLDCAVKITLSSSSVRVGPLGRDADGRVYWAVTPGVDDREIAFGILMSAGREFDVQKGKKQAKGKNRNRMGEDRKSMRKWSSFVAVWGRKPDVSNPVEGIDEEGEQNDKTDYEEERWWGFCEPEEIKRLASWISHKDGAREENSPDRDSSGKGSNSLFDSPGPATRDEIENLVRALKEYAEVQGWRIDREEAEEDVDDISVNSRAKGKGRIGGSKPGIVASSSFYA